MEKKNSFKKRAIAVTTGVVATIASVVYFTAPKVAEFKGVYCNDLSTFIGNDALTDTKAKEYKRKGFNAIVFYHAANYMGGTSNRAKLSKVITIFKRNGFKEIGLPYSAKSELDLLKSYNSLVSDSGRFNEIITEYEQYNTGNKSYFYALLKTGKEFATTYSMKADCYQGWLDAQDMDTIAKYTDRLFLHAYRQHDKYGRNAGNDCYGYMKSRIAMSVSTAKKISTTYKQKIVFIYSAENKVATATQFGYKYFQQYPVDTLQSWTKNSFTRLADSTTKARTEITGSMIFATSDYSSATKY